MAGLNYVLDTNVIAELFDSDSPTYQRMRRALEDGDLVHLCQPVHYEVMRGLLKVNATRKLSVYRDILVPALDWAPINDADWEQAARYWADTTSQGRQLSDVDLLVAAVAARLDGIVVTSDDDFDALPVKRETWCNPPDDME